jgi:hypothetical protein
MEIIDKRSPLWSYLSEEIKGLLMDGEVLLDNADEYKGKISDFSYLVFPFAKAYEGFLKRLFLDLGLMREDDYYGDEIRIGRILNPGFMEEHSSLYRGLSKHKKGGDDLSKQLWEVWKEGRNEIFHYFPHNFKKLTFTEALDIIEKIASAMHTAISRCGVADQKQQ